MDSNSTDIIIVAGGNSLRDFDFEKLQDKIVIAINESIHFVPFAPYFFACDRDFFTKKCMVNGFEDHKEVFKKYNGIAISRNGPAMTLKYNPPLPANSGLIALQFAIDLKPDRIFLLGYDMKRTKYAHFYDIIPIAYQNYFKVIIPRFDLLKYDCKIYNVTNDSALECFKKMSFKDFDIILNEK